MTTQEQLEFSEQFHTALAAVYACEEAMRLLADHDWPHAINFLRHLTLLQPQAEPPRQQITTQTSLVRTIEALEAARALWYVAQIGEPLT